MEGNPGLSKTRYAGNSLNTVAIEKIQQNFTYLLFCTSVSNKCLEIKIYSTPSLSWLRLALVVSVI